MSSLLTMSLLAIAFLASTAYASRLDPSLHSPSEKFFLVKGQSEEHSGAIPYTECMNTCDKCACTKMWPPEINMCFCLDGSVPKNPTAAAAAAVQKAPTEDPELIPYTECMETCKYCACTKMWPPESNWCICGMPKKPVAEGKKESNNKLDLLAGLVEKGTGGGGCMPYQECKAKCDSECIPCTKMWPPELNSHICLSLTGSANLKKPALQNSGGDDKQVVLWTKAKLETVPYDECIKTCKLCACTLPWPPGTELCICVDPKPQTVGGKALPV